MHRTERFYKIGDLLPGVIASTKDIAQPLDERGSPGHAPPVRAAVV